MKWLIVDREILPVIIWDDTIINSIVGIGSKNHDPLVIESIYIHKNHTIRNENDNYVMW